MRQRDRHERLLTAEGGRREAGAARDGFGEPDVAREVGVASGREYAAGQPDLFATLAVDEGELADRRHLIQKLRIVGAALLQRCGFAVLGGAGARHPGDLAFEVGQGLLDPLGGRFRLLAHAVVQRALDAAVGDPDFHRAVDRQHEHDEADQGYDVFGEQAFAQEPGSVLDLVHPDPRAPRGARASVCHWRRSVTAAPA